MIISKNEKVVRLTTFILALEQQEQLTGLTPVILVRGELILARVRTFVGPCTPTLLPLIQSLFSLYSFAVVSIG